MYSIGRQHDYEIHWSHIDFQCSSSFLLEPDCIVWVTLHIVMYSTLTMKHYAV
jgi:hypothetical protein